jgi:hypothetical protein
MVEAGNFTGKNDTLSGGHEFCILMQGKSNGGGD